MLLHSALRSYNLVLVHHPTVTFFLMKWCPAIYDKAENSQQQCAPLYCTKMQCSAVLHCMLCYIGLWRSSHMFSERQQEHDFYSFFKTPYWLSAKCLFSTTVSLNRQPPGLLQDYPSGVDPDAECCDVRWDLKVDNRSKATLKRTHPPCQHRTSLSSSAACRLCNSRLKLCLLVLVLLHTVASLTASHNATGMVLPAITSLEESPANEEW